MRTSSAQRAQMMDADTRHVRLRSATGTSADVSSGSRRHVSICSTAATASIRRPVPAVRIGHDLMVVQTELTAVVSQGRMWRIRAAGVRLAVTAPAGIGQTVVIRGCRPFNILPGCLLLLLMMLLHPRQRVQVVHFGHLLLLLPLSDVVLQVAAAGLVQSGFGLTQLRFGLLQFTAPHFHIHGQPHSHAHVHGRRQICLRTQRKPRRFAA